MNFDSTIYISGHTGLVGSALMRCLKDRGYINLITRTHAELDLTRQEQVEAFFAKEKPEYVFLAAAKVGGIMANSTYKAEFIYQNLMIAANVIHAAYKFGVTRLLNLGSSCIYPKFAPQPLKEEYLLTGPLEPTNEPYAIAKIAAIKLCRYYNEQYGTNYISLMPTNLYGPHDNFDLETSHVLPALIRKFHLAKLACQGDWEAIGKDEARFGTIPDDILSHLVSLGAAHGSSLIAPPLPPNALRLTPNAAPDALRLTPNASPVVVIWGSGSPRREFLYVDDLADACVFLMSLPDALRLTPNALPSPDALRLTPNASSSPDAQRLTPVPPREDAGTLVPSSPDALRLTPNALPSPDALRLTPNAPVELLNIGTGTDLTICALAMLVKDIVGYEGDIIWDTTKPDGTPQKLLDLGRMKKLGWEARTTLEEGIRKAYQWYMRELGLGG